MGWAWLRVRVLALALGLAGVMGGCSVPPQSGGVNGGGAGAIAGAAGAAGAAGTAGAAATASAAGSAGARGPADSRAPDWGRVDPGAAAPARGGSFDNPPEAPREFRAAWVATVANIDWPSAPGLSTAQQQSEALSMIERAAEIGLNALIFQIRPGGDAMYPSSLEPWSEFLTGAQGRAPNPMWDPLAFWIEQAHRRGIELHVWFNPYRARPSTAKSPLVAPHLGVQRPELVKTYGDQLWMDPGEPGAAARTLAVVADVVRRYDIDGVHMDDYFYPYPVTVDGVEQPFPDDASFARYQQGGGTLVRDDWRRANVDALVQRMHRTVHEIKPWVRFGISPFGVGKPARRPTGIIGFSQYDKLYADVERWLENGWLDYLAPQLYWQIEREGLQFPLLLDYWVTQNRARRHVWPGLFTSLITKGEPGTVLGPRAWLAREVLDQIALQRQRSGRDAQGGPGSTGHIHFSMVALMQNRDHIATLLHFGPYAQAALVPATPWLDDQAPPAPRLAWVGQGKARRVSIEPGGGEAAARWAVWLRTAGQWRFSVLWGGLRQIDPGAADAVVVCAVDRVGNLSERAALGLLAPGAVGALGTLAAVGTTGAIGAAAAAGATGAVGPRPDLASSPQAPGATR